MEVHFHHHATHTQAKFRKALNKKIYGAVLKRIKYTDLCVFFVYFAVLIWLAFKLIAWQEDFIAYYGNNFIIWAMYALILSFGLFVNYAFYQRPIWINKIFYQGTNALLTGKNVVRLQENGLLQKTEMLETLFSYSTIKSVEQIEEYLVIILGKNAYIAIAYSDFDNPQHRAEFENLLKQKIIH